MDLDTALHDFKALGTLIRRQLDGLGLKDEATFVELDDASQFRRATIACDFALMTCSLDPAKSGVTCRTRPWSNVYIESIDTHAPQWSQAVDDPWTVGVTIQDVLDVTIPTTVGVPPTALPDLIAACLRHVSL